MHCWGGLGSQLFALALIHDLKLFIPSREFMLVFHSSGVTKREPEIVELLPVQRFGFIDDYSIHPIFGESSLSKRIARMLIKKLAYSLGLIASANNDTEFGQVKLWTRHIRGHYSRRKISPLFLKSLESYLEKNHPLEKFSSSDIVVHYRLGDLLTLEEKRPVAASRLASEIIRLKNLFPGKVILLSDSPQEAAKLLSRYGIDCDLSFSNLESIQVINLARLSSHFVGTSSKISYWIILLRTLQRNDSSCSMPSSDLENLKPLIGEKLSNKINFY